MRDYEFMPFSRFENKLGMGWYKTPTAARRALSKMKKASKAQRGLGETLIRNRFRVDSCAHANRHTGDTVCTKPGTYAHPDPDGALPMCTQHRCRKCRRIKKEKP